MRLLPLAALSLASFCVLADPVWAHGGTYRGPEDTVPPGAGGGRGRTGGGPAGPKTPGPGLPGMPGAGNPVSPGSGSGPTTGGAPGFGPGSGPRTGGPVEADLTAWQFWWEFNKDAYLGLKRALRTSSPVSGSDVYFMGQGQGSAEALDTQIPTERVILEEVLPALLSASQGTDNRDIVGACLVALAKIGKDHEGRNLLLLPALRARLASHDQEIRETAALALGISQRQEAIPDLAGLFRDDAHGRKLCARSEVDDRTRAFAGYGLGLIGHATSDLPSKQRILQVLQQGLANDSAHARDLQVAAVNGMRMLRLNFDGKEDERALAEQCLQALWEFAGRKLGRSQEIAQAHVAPAIAQLLGRGQGPERARAKLHWVQELDLDQGMKVAPARMQSAAIALGLLLEPSDEDRGHLESLDRCAREAHDAMTRRFALIALGEIGGAEARARLVQHFQKARTLERQWAAIALGVLARRARDAGGAVDEEIGRMLRSAFQAAKNPDLQGALAIGLGLAGCTDAAEDLVARMQASLAQEELAGYLSIGLALMDAREARPELERVVRVSVRKPTLLKQAAIALGRLGDHSISGLLQEQLETEGTNVAKLGALATALGQIGDRRSIAPLVHALGNEDLAGLSRAFAAAALGGIADKELLPWSCKLAADINYRAAVPTLISQATGVLDIL